MGRLNLGFVALFSFFLVEAVNASSSKIPDKNPFRGSDVSHLSSDLKTEPAIKIYFSGNVQGMAESCGCALNPKGGFERRYNFLKSEGVLSKKRTLKDDVVLLDFGNLLFKSAVQGKDEKEAMLNASNMVEATNFFPFAAVNFGAMDRVVSADKLKSLWAKSKFTWLSSNIFPPDKLAATFHRRVPVKLKKQDLAVFGLSSMDDKLAAQGWKFEKPADVLAMELKDLPENVFPVVLSDLEVAELLPLAANVKRPVLFLGSRETGGWDRPIEVGQALLVHLRQQGQDWGVFKFSPKAKKTGWFNPADAESLAQRWDDLSTEALTMRSLASSDQKDIELKSIEAKMAELLKLAPAASDMGYSFEAIEMNATFDGPNEVSKFTK